MRTKLLSALLLASTALTGIASADPIIRDHRYEQSRPTISYRRPEAARRVQWEGGLQVNTRPSWMPQVDYGFQVNAAGTAYQPYSYGEDPYVEGIAQNEWMTIGSNLRLAYNQQSRINFNLGGERLQSLELQATGGRNWISEVHVQLSDGRELKLAVNRFVDVVHEPNMRLDLGASGLSGVRGIEIFGYSSGKGTFNVIGA